MEDDKVIEELTVLSVRKDCILMKRIYEHCKLIVIFVDEKCGQLAVDEERITIMLILHQLDHLQTICFGDFVLTAGRRVQRQVIRESNDGCLSRNCHIGESKGLKCLRDALFSHEPIEKSVVGELDGTKGVCPLVHFVDEVYCVFNIILNGILRN